MTQGSDAVAARVPRGVFETLVLTAGLPIIGWALYHNDPFLLDVGFPWLLFAPLLTGLLYGSSSAITSAGLLDLALVAAWRLHVPGVTHLPTATMVGLLALAMVCGQWSDVLRREIRRLRTGEASSREHLERLGAAYVLLDLSHDRLLQRQIRPPPNLRDAMLALRRNLDLTKGPEHLARPLLDLLESYLMVEVASIYRVTSDRISGEPLAVVGRPRPVRQNDALVVAALRTGALIHVPALGADIGAESTGLLAVLPLCERGKTRAVVCIEAMPFLAFERRSLEALSTFGARISEVLKNDPIQDAINASPVPSVDAVAAASAALMAQTVSIPPAMSTANPGVVSTSVRAASGAADQTAANAGKRSGSFTAVGASEPLVRIAGGSQKPAGGSQKPAGGSQKPAGGSQKPAGGPSEEPTDRGEHS